MALNWFNLPNLELIDNARDIYFGNYYVFLILVTDYGKLLNLIYMSSNRIKLS